jgi:hypothetical protein
MTLTHIKQIQIFISMVIYELCTLNRNLDSGFYSFAETAILMIMGSELVETNRFVDKSEKQPR